MGMLKIFVAQMTPEMGNISGNVRKIETLYSQAVEQGADICFFPELATTGYLIGDLFLKPSFRQDCQLALNTLRDLTYGQTTVLVCGMPLEERGKFYNAAVVFGDGYIQHVSKKVALARGHVFDDHRYFDEGQKEESDIVTIQGVRIGLMVCEDLWRTDLHRKYDTEGAQLIVSLNASPYSRDKPAQREEMLYFRVKESKLPILYVNRTGAEDGVIFDGRSMFVSETGQIEMVMPAYGEVGLLLQCEVEEEEKGVVRLRSPYLQPTMGTPQEEPENNTWQVLMEGVRHFVGNIGVSQVIVGLSGGIDSALVATIAVDALGPEAVHGLIMPGPYSRQESQDDAIQLAQNLDILYDVVPITNEYNGLRYTMDSYFSSQEKVSTVFENLQARLRGMLLMAWANQYQGMVLNTGNKSELAVGYCTLYGDMCGGLSVIGDIYKTEVYTLAHWRNTRRPVRAKGKALLVIPENTLIRPPSAELSPDQMDSDSLPPYEILDRVLELYVERKMSIDEIVQVGFERATVDFIVSRVQGSEFKRFQAPPIIRVSSQQFGRDRRYPISALYKEEPLEL